MPKKKFVLEGMINGVGFRQVISLPADSGGGTIGGGEVVIVVVPVVVIARERPAPKPKR
jgi:hypothetical protein